MSGPERGAGRRRVRMLVDDLFFATRIETAARHLDVDVLPAADADRPDLVIVDLHSRRDPLATIRAIKSSATTRDVPVVAFLSHVEAALRDQAVEAGADLVLPRSAFTAKLPEILAGRLPGKKD